jgi:hypothetical protein
MQHQLARKLTAVQRNHERLLHFGEAVGSHVVRKFVDKHCSCWDSHSCDAAIALQTHPCTAHGRNNTEATGLR